MNHASISFADIQAAAARIKPYVYRSPLHHSEQLSRLCGFEVYCKLDHMQITGSFKERGAVNKLLSLDDRAKSAGVICASAGNHALAVAYHGVRLGIPVTVVMPKWAPLIKVKNCRAFGAKVEFVGESFVEAYDYATRTSQQTGQTFIPGFDDVHIVTGAASAGIEILEDLPNVDVIIVPTGGGGLVAGIGLAVQHIKPGVQIIAVEPEHCPSLLASLKAGEVIRINSEPTLADGLAVAQVGKVPFDILRSVGLTPAQIELVTEPEIALAILRLMEMEKMVVEGAGAASLAAAIKLRDRLKGKKVALLLCGGNIDVTTLNKIIDRGLAADGRLCRITCRTSDRPGSLARLTAIFSKTGASVVEVFHDRHFGPADIAKVAITAILETRDQAHIDQIISALREEKIDVVV